MVHADSIEGKAFGHRVYLKDDMHRWAKVYAREAGAKFGGRWMQLASIPAADARDCTTAEELAALVKKAVEQAINAIREKHGDNFILLDISGFTPFAYNRNDVTAVITVAVEGEPEFQKYARPITPQHEDPAAFRTAGR